MGLPGASINAERDLVPLLELSRVVDPTELHQRSSRTNAHEGNCLCCSSKGRRDSAVGYPRSRAGKRAVGRSLGLPESKMIARAAGCPAWICCSQLSTSSFVMRCCPRAKILLVAAAAAAAAAAALQHSETTRRAFDELKVYVHFFPVKTSSRSSLK